VLFIGGAGPQDRQPRDEIDLLAFEQALRLGHGAVGLEFVVDDDDLDVLAGHLAAEVLDCELEAVAGLLAEHGGRAGQGYDDADLDFFLRDRRAGGDPQQNDKSCQLRRLLHIIPPLGRCAADTNATPICSRCSLF